MNHQEARRRGRRAKQALLGMALSFVLAGVATIFEGPAVDLIGTIGLSGLVVSGIATLLYVLSLASPDSVLAKLP
ncbi:hypothetical protein [Haloparvum sedimenti]|uniref:hypothetical protein n=1 Tax=Haloparvum sedimenti TaxID=1678448 RepID=UPI000F78BB51|nr:hypothetical protein [Haloparvum sedimenti]